MRNIMLCALIVALASCAGIDPQKVKPQAEVPDYVKAEEISVAFDQQMPIYAIVVEPVRLEGHRQTENGYLRTQKQNFEWKSTHTETSWSPDTLRMSAQLVSALSGVKNFSVYSYNSVKGDEEGKYNLKLAANETGPLVMRAMVTEYGSNIGFDKQKINLLIAGQRSQNYQAIVGVDVEVRDLNSGRVVAAFPVQATYSSRSLTNDTGILPIFSRTEFVTSLLWQALRTAMNEAALKLHAKLASKK